MKMTTTANAATWVVTSTTCPRCHKARYYVGDYYGTGEPPWCTCPPEPVHVSSPFNITPIRAAWECPRCHRVNAPHVDSCECEP